MPTTKVSCDSTTLQLLESHVLSIAADMRLSARGIFGVFAVAIIGCSSLQAREGKLRDRASFDMNCPKEELNLTDLGENKTYGVRGCGKQATYVGRSCSADMPTRNCQWLLNTDGTKTED